MAEYIKIDKNTFPTPYNINVGNYAQGWNACLDSVLQHRTADVVEVRHGEWVKDPRTADVCAEYRCSLCGFMYCEADPKYPPYKYCPECGSKNE